MKNLCLFLIILGGKPEGRTIEQHDAIFAVGETIEDTILAAKKHWKINIHIDTYMIIREVDGYDVHVLTKKPEPPNPVQLFFVNLGGYRANDLEEYHKKLVIPARSLPEAIVEAREDVFFTQGLTQGKTRTHVDDKFAVYGFDVDDALLVEEQIAPAYYLALKPHKTARFSKNKIVVGYMPLQ